MKNICIVRLSAVGDVCHVTAIARSIQDHYPNTKITWIIGKVESRLISKTNDIEFIVFDKKNGLQEYINIYKKLSKCTFDVSLLLHASLRANLISLMLKSPIKIGYDFARARDFQWMISNKKITQSSGKHVLDSMFEFLRLINIKTKNFKWNIPIDKKKASQILNLLSENRPNVIISPFSSIRLNNFRNWRSDNYSKIIEYLVSKYNCNVFLTGDHSEFDKKNGKEIELNCDSKLNNLIGKTSLNELAALIDNSDLVISPDSAPVHLATALNIDVIGLYASSNPKRTGPYQNTKYTLNEYPAACVKYLGKNEKDVKWGKRIRNPNVMDLIKLEDVIEKIDNYFADNSI